ncbi:hypothetical protein AGMMS50262_17910 [Bacteroidia bacterium]|nr:hypothetical protein AGMMS50262_17910 [Bacteroidia bacterium]
MKRKLLLFGFTLMLVPALFAQENNLQKLKNAFRSEYFNLSGYGQIVYNLTEHPEGNNPNSSIDVARAILFATGKLGEKNQFGYMLMYDFGPNARLHELYGEWTPLKSLNLRIGQYKIPFTIENPMSPTRIETINFSRSASAMSGSVGDVNQLSTGSKAGRDAGVQLSGLLFPKNGFYQLEYYTGLFNGSGFNTKDVDNRKDFIGTAYWQPIKGLRLGGSIYSGRLYDQVRNRWVVGGEYNSNYFYSRAEYISADDGVLKRNGYYGSLVWKLVPNRWEIVGKYDFYNNNTSLYKNGVSDVTAGINYYFAFLSRIQLNYVYSDDAVKGKNNTLLAQLQLFF